MQAGYTSAFRSLAGFNVFTAEHVPLRPRGAVMMIAPFLEERLFCRPVLRHMADRLMDAGWHTLRFDTPGEGDSDGDLAEIGLEDALRQIEYMAGILRERTTGPLVLIGLRWGASLALVSRARVGAEAVVAIEPLLDGQEYLQLLLRHNLATQMATWGRVRTGRAELLARSARGEPVNVQGFELGPRLVGDLERFAVEPEPGGARVALVRCGDDIPRGRWQALRDQPGVRCRNVPVRPFWFEPRRHDPVQPALQDAVHDQIREWFDELE